MSSALAQNSSEENQCRSQLMRMQIDRSAVNQALANNAAVGERILPALRTYLSSDAFKTSFVTDYPLEPVGFPFDKAICEREKARDPNFRNIDCNDTFLCGKSSVSDAVKTRLCFALPCSFVMGSQMASCAPQALARPKTLSFSSPVSLKKLDIVPENVSITNGNVRSCFLINSMDLGLGVAVDFDGYQSIGLNNLNVNLEAPRRVCLSAVLDVTKNPPISGVSLEHVGGQPFVSNAMIDKALRTSTVTGLTGYSPETLEILKVTGLPPLARHFRPSIENAIAQVLSSTFETSVSGYIAGVSTTNGPTRVDTPADSMISELGVGNIAVKKYVDVLDCALLKKERKPIPREHACLAGSSVDKVPTPENAVKKLKETMARNSNVTSESIRKRLVDFGPRMNALKLAQAYSRDIAPIATQIQATQSNSTLMSGIELVGGLSGDSQLNVGFCLPDICERERPSAHEGRSIPNCPIQTYVDINELNNLLKAMYDSGRLCHRGRGDFVPQTNARGEIVRDRSGLAQGAGCLLAVEEDPDGLRCYLNGPPKMIFDQATKRYNVDMKTKECFRGGVFAGIGKIGGDINFNIGFTPSICNGGDFCLENGEATWNVVPGTARFALRESSWLNSVVRKTIDGNLRDIVSNSLRFPVSSTQGPLSNVPVVPEGRVDLGDGYFGACLKVR